MRKWCPNPKLKEWKHTQHNHTGSHISLRCSRVCLTTSVGRETVVCYRPFLCIYTHIFITNYNVQMVKQHLIQGASQNPDCQHSAIALWTDSKHWPVRSFLHSPQTMGKKQLKLCSLKCPYSIQIFTEEKHLIFISTAIFLKRRMDAHRKSITAEQYGWDS